MVSQGHSLNAVLKYSLRQFRTLLDLAREREASNHLVTAGLFRMAYHADTQQYEDFTRALSTGA